MKQKQETLTIHRKSAVLQRSLEQVNEHIEYLNTRGIPFKVHSSQYSTVIDSNGVKVRYVTQVYDDRVFMCSRMIQGNLGKRNIDYILKGHFSTNNYQSKKGLEPGNYGKVINIDISGAYPNCLYNEKLIDKKVYDFLMDLGKKERLPAIGMIAKKTLVYQYNGGSCVDVNEENGKYQKVFHFIVYQINELMKRLQRIAGEYYIMHWVDGIFLKKDCPKNIILKMVETLKADNYNYKFEKIDDFKVERDDDTLRIIMMKNGQLKDFKFMDQNMVNLYNKIAERLNNDALDLYADPSRDIQLSPGISHSDWQDFFA